MENVVAPLGMQEAFQLLHYPDKAHITPFPYHPIKFHNKQASI